MEKEEIQALIDEKLQAFTTEINEGLDEFKTDFDIGARIDPLNERLGALEELKESLRGFDFAGLDTRISTLEELKVGIEVLVERLENVEGFKKAFGEDFDFTKFEERIVAIEDMPLVKGVITGPPEGMADIHDKLGSVTSFEEGAKLIRGLQQR